MLEDYDNKMMPAPANKEGILTRNQIREVLNEKGAPIIHPAFAERFAAGWKIVPSKCPCGGKWAWMRPRGKGKGFVLHGCICHETPETS